MVLFLFLTLLLVLLPFLLALLLPFLILLGIRLLTLGLFPLPLLLLELLLIDAGEDGAGEGQVVLGVGVSRIAAQNLFIGGGGTREVTKLEASVAQVVGGVIRQLGSLVVGKGIGGLGIALGPIKGDTLAIGIGKPLRSAGIIASLEAHLGLLFWIIKPAGLGG